MRITIQELFIMAKYQTGLNVRKHDITQKIFLLHGTLYLNVYSWNLNLKIQVCLISETKNHETLSLNLVQITCASLALVVVWGKCRFSRFTDSDLSLEWGNFNFQNVFMSFITEFWIIITVKVRMLLHVFGYLKGALRWSRKLHIYLSI
jgi:hypothetical protein